MDEGGGGHSMANFGERAESLSRKTSGDWLDPDGRAIRFGEHRAQPESKPCGHPTVAERRSGGGVVRCGVRGEKTEVGRAEKIDENGR